MCKNLTEIMEFSEPWNPYDSILSSTFIKCVRDGPTEELTEFSVDDMILSDHLHT